MKRMNLKELRDTLNKMSETDLEISALTTDLCTDCGEGEFAIIMMCGEDEPYDETTNAGKFYNSEEYRKLKTELVNPLNKDLTALKLREGEEGYNEEYGIEPDW